MIVIRRLVDRQRAYTAIFLPGEPAQIFPTSDQEHGSILAVYKQERAHEGIINDFSEFALGKNSLPPGFGPRKAVTLPVVASADKNSAADEVPQRNEVNAGLWLTTNPSPGALGERGSVDHNPA